MRPAALVVGLCWLIPATVFSQGRTTPRIQGLVVDSVTGRVIPNAVVMLEGAGEVWTDRAGWYALNQVPDGEYLLAAVTRDCRIAAVRLRLAAGPGILVVKSLWRTSGSFWSLSFLSGISGQREARSHPLNSEVRLESDDPSFLGYPCCLLIALYIYSSIG